MKKIKMIIAILFVVTFNNIYAQDKQHQIVFQFTNGNDSMQQKAFIKQLENLTDYWPKANYEVVVYNQGLELLMKTNTAYIDRIKNLQSKGVRFLVCENTLKNRKISKDAFDTSWVEFIPAGIAEIVEKQEMGWSYIKGGF